MKNLILIFLVLGFVTNGLFAQNLKQLIPLPESYQEGNGFFPLGKGTRIVVPDSGAWTDVTTWNELLNQVYGFRLYPAWEKTDEGNYIVLERKPVGGNPAEAYKLSVKPDAVEVMGDGSGLFYALISLLQLIEVRDGNYVIPCCTIADEPRFLWRG